MNAEASSTMVILVLTSDHNVERRRAHGGRLRDKSGEDASHHTATATSGSMQFHLLGSDDGSADHWTGKNRNAHAKGGHAFFSDAIQIMRLDGRVNGYNFEAQCCLAESSPRVRVDRRRGAPSGGPVVKGVRRRTTAYLGFAPSSSMRPLQEYWRDAWHLPRACCFGRGPVAD